MNSVVKRALGVAWVAILAASACVALDKSDVATLVRQGVQDNVILAVIAQSGARFDLSADEIVDLHGQGVSLQVLDAMTGRVVYSTAGSTRIVVQDDTAQVLAQEVDRLRDENRTLQAAVDRERVVVVPSAPIITYHSIPCYPPVVVPSYRYYPRVYAPHHSSHYPRSHSGMSMHFRF